MNEDRKEELLGKRFTHAIRRGTYEITGFTSRSIELSNVDRDGKMYWPQSAELTLFREVETQ